MAPQIIWLALMGIGLGMDFARHGQQKTGTHNGWVSLAVAPISAGLLWWGGFFAPLLGNG